MRKTFISYRTNISRDKTTGNENRFKSFTFLILFNNNKSEYKNGNKCK